MRLAVTSLLCAALAAVAASAAPAATTASCSQALRYRGAQYIVIGTGVGCRQAISMTKALIVAPVIGRRTVNGLRLLILRSPRAGWTCATTSPIRSKGAGCAKGALKVIYVKFS
jgi:hypothetical protein